MKRVAIVLVASTLMIGCASHRAYETARFRDRAYTVDQITLTEGGLTAEQIKTITSTRPPSQFPVDISLIVVRDRFVDSEMGQLFLSKAIEGAKASPNIDRIVPVPEFLLPQKLNYSVIQELGIRTLSEYVVLFIVDAESFFKWTKIVKTKYKITSSIEFVVLDSQTTAILASDRLFSTITYDEDLFKTGEKEKAQNEIFSEQGQLLGEKLAELFNQPK